ncbi:MAG: cytochrome c-type biogenesis protein CcmH [Nitrospirales bacterium]|nr:cytochrome c-type biogenesis protein CcmH [Nitrospirales bacterium]
MNITSHDPKGHHKGGACTRGSNGFPVYCAPNGCFSFKHHINDNVIRQSFVILCLCLLVALVSEAHATTIDETHIDVKTREIAKTLRCTVCQTENIWESGAPLAQQMRSVVRERVKQGQSAKEIREYFLSRYGDYILMQPPKRGINWLIWIGPFALLLIGGFLLYREIARWVTHAPRIPSDLPPPLDEESRRRLERERRLEH